MKFTALIFLFITFAVIEAMVIATTTDGLEIDFPEMGTPELNFKDIGECSGIASCTKLIAFAIFNGALGIIAAVQYAFYLSRYIVQIIGLVLQLSFTGIPGAPFYVDLIVMTPLLGTLGVIIYKLLRTGNSEA
jgi:hypothetical protein